MATTYKVLGQSGPAAATLTSAYTVPSATSAVVSTIHVLNRSGSTDTIRIAVRPAGETIANKHYLVYDLGITSGQFLTLTIGITLATTDVLSVYSRQGLSVFNIFGSEVS
jgi:imidazoleglycerol phosphate dehydratase HisB